jgi:hypothetical protein
MAPLPRHSGNPARADRTSARLTPHEAAVEASIVARALDRTPHYEEAHQAHMRAASRWSLIARLSRVPSVRDRARAQIEAHLDAADEVMVRALGALLGRLFVGRHHGDHRDRIERHLDVSDTDAHGAHVSELTDGCDDRYESRGFG